MRSVACLILAMAGLLGAVTPARAVDLVRTPYNQPQVTESGGTTELRVTDRPAGLSYRATLDPQQTYRVRLRGRVDQTGMVLRIARDGKLEYTRTPAALTALQVSGVTDLELLIFRSYETDDERYRIDELSVTECPDCPDDADLRAQVLQESPGLDEALQQGDRLGIARAVSRWVATHVAIPGGAPQLQVVGRERTAVELYYGHFATAEAGVNCAGIAELMAKVLDLFGVPSFEVHFGDPSIYTHAVVMVEAEGDWFMFDPTFDVVPEHAGSGAPLPVFAAVELWRAGRSDLIELGARPLPDRPIVYDGDEDGVLEPLLCGNDPASGWSGCGLANLAHDWDATFAASGLGTGYDALLALFARTDLFSTEELRVPAAFVSARDRLRDAVLSGAPPPGEAPLAPVLRRAPAPGGTPTVGEPLTVDAGDWDLEPWRWGAPAGSATASLTIAWQRCDGECRPLPTTVPGADLVGVPLRAVVTAANRYASRRILVEAGEVRPAQATPAEPSPAPTAPPVATATPPRACPAAARIATRGRGPRRRAVLRLCATAPRGWRVHIEIRRRGGARTSRIVRVRHGRTRVVRMRLGGRPARITVRRAGRCGSGRCWRLLTSRGVLASPA